MNFYEKSLTVPMSSLTGFFHVFSIFFHTFSISFKKNSKKKSHKNFLENRKKKTKKIEKIKRAKKNEKLITNLRSRALLLLGHDEKGD